MKLHVLGLVHTETTDKWSACAFTARTMAFAAFMKAEGYEVILYAGQHNTADVSEHVPIVTVKQQQTWYPGFDETKVFNEFDSNSLPWRVFNMKAAAEIRARASAGDILCITMGYTHKPVADALADLGLHVVETGIGYTGIWAPFRVFESNAWRHFLASREKTDDIRWFDTVIPRGYPLEHFPTGPGAGGNDYLFMGRLTVRKGPRVAAEVCQAIGGRLLVAGQGAASWREGLIVTDQGIKLEGDVHYLGVLNPEQRKHIMSTVRAVIMPTQYLEPGGGVAIEAQLCGTPVITVPWGAMTETVIDGLTGFHCSTLKEFVDASVNVGALDRGLIQRTAQRRFSAGVVAKQYHKYFNRLSTLEKRGWYEV